MTECEEMIAVNLVNIFMENMKFTLQHYGYCIRILSFQRLRVKNVDKFHSDYACTRGVRPNYRGKKKKTCTYPICTQFRHWRGKEMDHVLFVELYAVAWNFSNLL